MPDGIKIVASALPFCKGTQATNASFQHGTYKIILDGTAHSCKLQLAWESNPADISEIFILISDNFVRRI